MKNTLLIGLFILLVISCSKNEKSLMIEELEKSETPTSTFKNGVNNIGGFNWADGRDNFVDGWVIPSGLSAGDSYSTVQTKANTILSAFSDAGANTVRLPINPPSVLESWWDSYKGAIDMAISKGMKVIVACWESSSAKDGKVDDLSEFWNMWDVVVNDYGSNSAVYFEVMNEPFGYSTSELISLYNSWLSRYSSLSRNRIMLGGTGYCDNVNNIGGSFPNCLLSQHLYAWWGYYTTISGWENELSGRIGSYGDRTVLTEFGADMTSGYNYNGSINGNYQIAFIQGMASYCSKNNLASVYWPGLRDGDSFSMYTFNGSTMSLTNSSGLDQIKIGWSSSSSSGGYFKIINRNSGKALEVEGQSTSNGANVDQWDNWDGNNQQWVLNDLGNGYYSIINRNSGKALEIEGQSTSNGANADQWDNWGGNNQQWALNDLGNGYYSITNRNSGKALEIEGQSATNGANVDQWDYWGGNNQQWQITEL